MGLMTGKTESSSSPGGSGGGLMSKLSSVTSSVFSKKKKAKPKSPTSSAPHSPPPPPIAESAKPHLPSPTKEEKKEATPQGTATKPSTAIQGAGGRATEVLGPVLTAVAQQGFKGAEKGKAAKPTDVTAAVATMEVEKEKEQENKEKITRQDGAVDPPPVLPGASPRERNQPTELTPTAELPAAAQRSGAEEEGTAAPLAGATVVVTSAEDKKEACLVPGKATGAEEKEACVDSVKEGAEVVDPKIRVVPFAVREPSLGASVVGHIAILDGSCYVWAGTEGSALQGSLAAAVATKFDGGMPTATPLLAGGGGGEGDVRSGGVGVSMAQRLCRRTGRVVFVSCDLSEDSQILVAAVESKVLALLKAED